MKAATGGKRKKEYNPPHPKEGSKIEKSDTYT